MTIRTILSTVALIALSACGEKPSAPEPGTGTEAPATAAVATPAALPAAPAAAPAPAPELPAVPAGAKVFFIAPTDAAKVEGPLENGKVSVHVQMGAENILIKPAGEVEAGAGHHHILIDAEPVPAGTPVPKDETHLHFGKGQTEATVLLAPGDHTLMLQLADGMHRSYGAPLAASAKISVVAAGTVQAQPQPIKEPETKAPKPGTPKAPTKAN
jgi:hypothetical protein